LLGIVDLLQSLLMPDVHILLAVCVINTAEAVTTPAYLIPTNRLHAASPLIMFRKITSIHDDTMTKLRIHEFRFFSK